MNKSLSLKVCLLVLTPLLIGALTSKGHSAEWGNLKGTFVYDGDVPKAKPLTIKKDVAVCGKHKLVDESLVVHPTSKGIKNIILYIYSLPGGKKPSVHPSYTAKTAPSVQMTNKNCRFEPRVCLMRTSQTLVLANDDPLGHNMKGNSLANPAFNDLIPSGGKAEQTLRAEERLPVKVDCNIHDWMTGWLVVKDHPYMAVTDENGKFEIKNLPAGKWTFQAWQEKSGYVADVDHKGKSWRRGRFTVTISGGKTEDLGVVKVKPKAFEE